MASVSKYLIDESPLVFMPSLAKEIGLNESIVLQQVQYWINKSGVKKDNHIWIYNTYEEWLEQFSWWSMSTLKRTFSSLEKDGLLISGNYNRMAIDKTKWYSIDYKVLENRVSRPSGQIDTMGNDENTETLTESNENRVSRPSGQNEPLDGSNWSDGLGQNDTTNNQRLPETNTDINHHDDTHTDKSKSGAWESKQMAIDLGLLTSNTVTQFFVDDYQDLSNRVGVENVEPMMLRALGITAKASNPSLNYVEGILKRWEENNIKTVAEAEAREQKRSATKSNSWGRQKRKVETMPDYSAAATVGKKIPESDIANSKSEQFDYSSVVIDDGDLPE
ncbi:DnaD domain protein [Periweissella cryptocerci]|uniref:DnaD domain protein n=1 Tax=Periweissella cryptocerci TaxID=2506420 RepID=A0A4P6YVX5_9LACO|nr:DnaD domain protein [Periweissella cryptocerci]QBO36950.1 DnaD domain protein [Periweissella cryptocerci]